MKKLLMIIAPLLFIGCSFFKSSKDIELIPYAQKDKYGYFDLEGKIVINPQFEFATVFREGLALVRTTGEKGKWGYIDKDGKFVINATYKNATVFQEGLAWVVIENSAPSAIDKNGEIKFTLNDAESVRLFSDDLAAYSKMDSTSIIWGFVDKSGKQAINPQFEEVGNFSDGKCVVKNKDGKWGYIDKSGKIIINYQFDDATKFEDGKAIVHLDDKAGVIDEDGKYLINPQFQSIYIDNNKYLIVQDDKAGWCDKDGKFLINPQFDDAEIFGDSDIACIKTGDKFGYIDEDGKININPQFDNAFQFIGDIAIVKMGDKYGIIDKKGKYVVNPQFETISFDVYSFLNDFSYKNSVDSDYLNTEAILKVIDYNKPEGLSLEDNFKSILKKTNKNANDFSASNSIHLIFENKYINNDSTFDFAVMGNLKYLDPYSYEYVVSTEKPTGYLYGINLKGKATGKNEILQKAFEKKLTSYKLMKKGFIDDEYTSVYKSDNNIIITLNNLNGILIYVLNSDYEISYYLNKIVEISGKSTNNYNEQEVTEEVAPVVEEAAPIIDSVTY